MGNVLVVDDESGIRDGLVRAVGAKGHRALSAGSLGDARRLLAAESIDCVLLDVRLEDGDGLDLLREIRESGDDKPPVIMATAYGDSPRAIAAMKAGAFEYLTKPFDLPQLLDAVERAIKAKALTRGGESKPRPVSSETLVGSSAAMLEVWKVIGRAAASDVPVLIVGETGTGKDLVARAIHENSARAKSELVAVNLASLSANLIESELMGHEKGAFTGAVALRLSANGPGAAAGIRAGDIITKINGQPVNSEEEFKAIERKLTIGQKAPVELMRGNQSGKATLTVGEAP